MRSVPNARTYGNRIKISNEKSLPTTAIFDRAVNPITTACHRFRRAGNGVAGETIESEGHGDDFFS